MINKLKKIINNLNKTMENKYEPPVSGTQRYFSQERRRNILNIKYWKHLYDYKLERGIITLEEYKRLTKTK